MFDLIVPFVSVALGFGAFFLTMTVSILVIAVLILFVIGFFTD